ncbi:MAG: heme exporter protein CcmD [Gammaproteobacteria bacterium]|nr:heme exporter protein CcmD [Gammaproteobacteria bacterium]
MNAVSEFFHMGGYAVFVWASYGLTAVLLVVSWVLPEIKRKTLLKKMKRKQDLES